MVRSYLPTAFSNHNIRIRVFRTKISGSSFLEVQYPDLNFRSTISGSAFFKNNIRVLILVVQYPDPHFSKYNFRIRIFPCIISGSTFSKYNIRILILVVQYPDPHFSGTISGFAPLIKLSLDFPVLKIQGISLSC